MPLPRQVKSFRIRPDLWRRLQGFSKQTGQTASAIIEKAVEEYLNKTKP